MFITATNLFLVACGALTFYVAAICIYRIYFHPLASYPGPLLAKVTNLYSAFHAWKGDLHTDMWKCHKKYGHTVRYAPNRLLFDSHNAWQDIYGFNSNVIKSSLYAALVHIHPNILTCRDKSQHSRRRKIVSQGLSDASLRSLEPQIITQITKFCDSLVDSCTDQNSVIRYGSGPDDAWSSPKDLARWCDYLTFDIMSSVIFSGNYDALGKNDFRWVPNAIEGSNVRVGVLTQAPELKLWRLDKKLFPESIRQRNRFVKFITKMVGNRMALAGRGTVRDVFSFLAEAKDGEDNSALSPTELGAESTTLIVAGTDTTSTAMAAMLFYLSQYPAAHKRATEEVRQVFQSADEIRTGALLNSCKFLRACIDETMRISPSAGSALLREVLPGGAMIDGYFVPQGCDVGVGIYAMHHNTRYYSDPFAFKPERWMVGECDVVNSSESPRLAYAPFSSGPRGCIGKKLALTELMLTMAMLLHRLDFRLPDESLLMRTASSSDEKVMADEYQTLDHVTAVKTGPVLQFRRRL